MSHRKRPPSGRAKPAASSSEGAGERLQKVLAAAGTASRRECESLILEGRVEVDRKVVTELGTRVDPSRQEIRVDGTALPRTKRVYFIVNKPPGVLCTNSDPAGRMRVIDLIEADERLFTVGRLDRSSEGLILLTNDGELANQLTHPRYGVDKTYAVRVAGVLTPEQLSHLRRGIHLAEGQVRVAALNVKRRYKESMDLEIVLNEGRNREIRRMLARLGHKVLTLKRIAMGSVRLGNIPLGAHRRLTKVELQKLEECVHSRRREMADKGPRESPKGEKRERRRPAAPGKQPRPPRQTGFAKPPRSQGSILAYDADEEFSVRPAADDADDLGGEN